MFRCLCDVFPVQAYVSPSSDGAPFLEAINLSERLCGDSTWQKQLSTRQWAGSILWRYNTKYNGELNEPETKTGSKRY